VQGKSYTSHRLINSEATPVFQYAVFYTDDCEINPPQSTYQLITEDNPNVTVRGRIHTNGDLYLNTGGIMVLDSNYIRAVGNLYRDRKGTLTPFDGPVRIRQWVADPFDPLEPVSYAPTYSQTKMSSLGITTTSGYDSDFTVGHDDNGDGDFDDANDFYPWAPGALKYWSEPSSYSSGTGTTVMTGDHNVPTASSPMVGSIAMFDPDPNGTFYFDTASGQYQPAAPGMGTHSKGFYYSQADLSIITYADTSIKIFDKSGTDLTSTLTGVASTSKMYDARQANANKRKIITTEVDLGQLKALGAYPANGLIYMGSYKNGKGVRIRGSVLKNGSELDAPLTVACQNSLYIHGDYNTTNKQPASVIADAVNLLSNGWDDTKAKGVLPLAKETSYNVAIIAGDTNTVGSQYSGGLENLPRLHENWDAVKLNLTGSLVNAWSSQYADAIWQLGGHFYTPPNPTNYSYDTMFNNVANLPPFTPLTVVAVDVAVW
jgi:hypothetical protein